METLVLNGKMYVKAAKAAQDLGYTSDYVGQLCRSGNVDAHLVGRTWYVNPDTLTVHKTEKKRSSRLKAREYAKKAIEESRALKVNNTKNSYRNITIRYKDDQSGLIPEVRKITAARSDHYAVVSGEKTGDHPYQIENKDKKIIMSGTIKVTDADELVESTDTVLLTPNFRKRREERAQRLEPSDISEKAEKETKIRSSKKQESFTERLLEYGTEITKAPNTEIPLKETPAVVRNVDGVRIWVLLSAILILAVLGTLSVCMEERLVWSDSMLMVDYVPNWEVIKW